MAWEVGRGRRDNAVVGRLSVSDEALRRMRAEAGAQYDMCPSDYLEGVLTVLSEVLDGVPFVEGRREDEQARWAAGRSAVSRAREHYRGRIATLRWMVGEADTPPVQQVLTAGDGPAGPPRREIRVRGWRRWRFR
jgi:hypothetical protein